MDKQSIVEALDECLVSKTSMNGSWDGLSNPFPGTMSWAAPPMEQRLVMEEDQ